MSDRMVGSESTVLDDTALAGLLANCRLALADTHGDEFQQMTVLFSSRPGYGPEDSIPFTHETCQIVFRHLVDNGILCLRTDVTIKGRTLISLTLANTQRGLDRCVETATMAAARFRGTLKVYRTVEEANQ